MKLEPNQIQVSQEIENKILRKIFKRYNEFQLRCMTQNN